MGTLQISFKCLLSQRFPPWWKGCVCVCYVCLTLWRVRDYEQTITVTLRGVTDALWQPLLALVRESQLGGQELPSCRVC